MTVTMATSDLKTIFSVCKGFISKSDLHPALHGIFLEFRAKTCTAYASDGFKMMQIVVPVTDGGDGEMLIPVIALPKDPFVTLTDEGNEITFDFGSFKQTVKKYNGEFFKNPNHFFTDNAPQYTIYFDAKSLKTALTGFGGNAIKLDFYKPLDACIITQNPDRRALIFPVNPKK